MGMSAGGGGGGGKKRAVADINITPMVDVMLVLLVIFMITAPSIKQIEGMEVNLPEQSKDLRAEELLLEDSGTIAITAEGLVAKFASSGQVAKEGSKKDGDSYGNLDELVDDLKTYKKTSEAAQKKPVVVIAGDKDVKHQVVMQVCAAVKKAGVRNVSFQLAEWADEKKPAEKATDAKK